MGLRAEVIEGDCLDVLPSIPDASIDAVVCDPPYPCIKRAYGTMTEAEWDRMMRGVVAETRRVLKPTGSAVFILQPNSERLGRMRPWLWEFMAWTCHEWNMVQDAWWWNTAAMPCASGQLMRPSVKACVWLGSPDCYRSQDDVLWNETARNVAVRASARFERISYPSGHSVNHGRACAAAEKRGGVTPYNLLPCPNTSSVDSAGSYGHPAGTPANLANWWLRYLTPPGGTALDPFVGSGTMGIEAVKLSLNFIGIERDPGYVAIARGRIEAARTELPLFVSKAV